MQVRTTAVGVKRTLTDERMSLSPELDAVVSHNMFNWVDQLQSGRVDLASGGPDKRGHSG